MQIGGSLTDVYKEANDIIEEFKREEESAPGGGGPPKYYVKRNSHAAPLNTINIGVPVPVGTINNNNRPAKRNNFALTRAGSHSRNLSEHDIND